MLAVMLHLRSPLRRATTALGATAAGFAYPIIDSDPGSLRWFLALRGTASMTLSILAAVVLGPSIGASPIDLAVGITFSLLAPFWMREPNRPDRERTLLLLIFPAVAAVLATTALHGHQRLGDASFLALVFVVLLLQGRSPRAIGLGVEAVIIGYVGLFLQLPLADLPVQLLGIAVAVAITWFSAFVVVPLRPAAALRRTVQAVQVRAAAVLHTAGALRDDDPATARALRRSLARLNEVALAADDQLAVLYPVRSVPLRCHLMDLELAAARLAIAPLDAASVRGKGPDHRRTVQLQVHERRLRQGRWKPRHWQGVTPASPSAVGAVLSDIARAAAALGQAASELPVAAKPRPAPRLPPGPLAWRQAFRVTLASAIAMAGGMALSPERWFWAVISCYVVFLGTRSRGETVYKGVQRLAGTLLGLLAGVSLAILLQGLFAVQLLLLLAAVFGMFYLFFLSYAAGIFCVTVFLGLVYSLLGAAMAPILELRLEETLVGASSAIFVAVCILPLRTRDRVAESGAAVLRALADAIGVCRRALAGEGDAAPVPAMRAVDRQVADLRLALLPMVASRFLLRRTEPERPIPALLACVHWARMLAVAATAPDPDAAERAARVESKLRSLADGGQADPMGHGESNDQAATAAAQALDKLDMALSALVERLAIGALHGFQLEG